MYGPHAVTPFHRVVTFDEMHQYVSPPVRWIYQRKPLFSTLYALRGTIDTVRIQREEKK